MQVDRTKRQVRSVPTQFRAAETDGDYRIEGYFAVFGSNYNIFDGATESIAPSAFDGTLDGDIRALVDHDTRLVLGRTKADTLTLSVDEHGLWGVVMVNPLDTDAMNLYRRVERGDVDQCSFGFDILSEVTEERPDGTVHWTITKVLLYEVSCVTFPAYEDTSIIARKLQYDQIKKRRAEAWRAKMKGRLINGIIANRTEKENQRTKGKAARQNAREKRPASQEEKASGGN